MNDIISHHGIKGQKWGVRRFRNKDGTLTPAGRKRYGESDVSDAQKERNRQIVKKVAIGAGAALTVTAAAAMYAAHKDEVDNYIKSKIAGAYGAMTIREGVKNRKREDYAKTHKNEILKSASKITKYREYLRDDDVADAIKRLQQNRDLHQLSQDNIRRGANYVQAFLAYGAAATTAYNLKNSQLAKDMKNPKKRKG